MTEIASCKIVGAIAEMHVDGIDKNAGGLTRHDGHLLLDALATSAARMIEALANGNPREADALLLVFERTVGDHLQHRQASAPGEPGA